jgi:hypothetical protein
MAERLATSILFAMLIVTGGRDASAHELSRITIHIQNQAEAPAATLAGAARRVESVFAAAGLQATWRESPLPLHADSFQLTVVITAAISSKESTGDNVLGVAPESPGRCGRVAYVFWDRVADYAVHRRQDPAVVLAMVIAHEMGHLLLPAGSHAMVGVMRAEWREDDFAYAKSGRLGFSQSERTQIRERIRTEGRITAALVNR